MQKTVKTLAVIALFALVVTPLSCESKTQEKKNKTALCSTFPIYQIVRNIVQGRTGMEARLMLPAEMGCPHDYVLTPQDMRNLAQADVLVINGLGLEEFLGAPMRRANPDITIVDSSKGIQDLLPYTKDGHEHGHEDGFNPHLFASPEMARRLALNIATELSKIDPAGAAVYSSNAAEYDKKMKQLTAEFKALLQRLRNNRVLTQHGVFDYLARDTGLDVVAHIQAHPGQQPSAGDMLRIVKIAKEKKAGAVLNEPQYPDKVGETIAKEVGIPSAILDPGATGPENAPIDHFEKVMRANMKTLETVLGAE